MWNADGGARRVAYGKAVSCHRSPNWIERRVEEVRNAECGVRNWGGREAKARMANRELIRLRRRLRRDMGWFRKGIGRELGENNARMAKGGWIRLRRGFGATGGG
jgi:hypothetical protein